MHLVRGSGAVSIPLCARCTCVSDAVRGGGETLRVLIGALQKKDSAWAEPRNKNPLEKTTLSRQGITAQSKEMKDEGLVRSPVQTVALLISHTKYWQDPWPRDKQRSGCCLTTNILMLANLFRTDCSTCSPLTVAVCPHMTTMCANAGTADGCTLCKADLSFCYQTSLSSAFAAHGALT